MRANQAQYRIDTMARVPGASPGTSGFYAWRQRGRSVRERSVEARQKSSMAKVFCSEAEFRVIDRCMQILGGIGITTDTLVERLWREIRPFRIYDGPNEVHRWAIAKRIAKAARSRG